MRLFIAIRFAVGLGRSLRLQPVDQLRDPPLHFREWPLTSTSTGTTLHDGGDARCKLGERCRVLFLADVFNIVTTFAPLEIHR